MLDPFFPKTSFLEAGVGAAFPCQRFMAQILMFALTVVSQMQPETSPAPFQTKPGFLLAAVGTHTFVPCLRLQK